MEITFRCEHCHKDVKAPDSAAGKRGKCPFCGHSTYIPAPVKEEDVLQLAPLDEEEERRRAEEIRALREAERAILAESKGAGTPAAPLAQREDIRPEDLHHLVVNYCIDMFEGNLTRAQTHAGELKKSPFIGRTAIDDFTTGRASEPALKPIPPRVLKGYLAELRRALGG